jgi:hypothetical protein
MGQQPESTCFISTPEVTRVMQEWFKHDHGAGHPVSWNGIYDDSYGGGILGPLHSISKRHLDEFHVPDTALPE